MNGRCLLGIDIGTYSSKGVLVKDDGEVAAESMVEHSLDIPGPGRAEHDPDRVWWRDFLAICSDLLERSAVSPGAARLVDRAEEPILRLSGDRPHPMG